MFNMWFRVKALLSETKDECMQSPIGDAISINNKVVDLRKEKAILRDMSYLEGELCQTLS